VGSHPSDSSGRPCARCGFVIAPGARFCGHCGLTVSGEPSLLALDRPDERAGPSTETEPPSDLVADFSLAARLLGRHPVMIVPPLIAMAVVVVTALLLFGGALSLFGLGLFSGRRPVATGVAVGTALLFVIVGGVAMLMNLISSAVVVVMAKDALAGRAPTIGAAFGAVTARLGDVIGASLLCGLIIGVASVFLFIPGLIAAFFFMFTMPLVLLDGAGPTASMRRSAGLVGNNLGRAVGLVGGAIVAGFIVWVASIVLQVLGIVGRLASIVLSGVFLAYVTVVVVRVFQTLPRR